MGWAATKRSNDHQWNPHLGLGFMSSALPLQPGGPPPPRPGPRAIIKATDGKKPAKRYDVIWECNKCKKQCLPIRGESWCLCGHRRKVHKQVIGKDGKISIKCTSRARGSGGGKCKCEHFYYIAAQGAWILRCRCKHKHIDHNPAPGKHVCTRKSCKKCVGFDSPWVCNCGCKWIDHTQKTVERKTRSILDLAGMAISMMQVDRRHGDGGLTRSAAGAAGVEGAAGTSAPFEIPRQ